MLGRGGLSFFRVRHRCSLWMAEEEGNSKSSKLGGGCSEVARKPFWKGLQVEKGKLQMHHFLSICTAKGGRGKRYFCLHPKRSSGREKMKAGGPTLLNPTTTKPSFVISLDLHCGRINHSRFVFTEHGDNGKTCNGGEERSSSISVSCLCRRRRSNRAKSLVRIHCEELRSVLIL